MLGFGGRNGLFRFLFLSNGRRRLGAIPLEAILARGGLRLEIGSLHDAERGSFLTKGITRFRRKRRRNFDVVVISRVCSGTSHDDAWA